MEQLLATALVGTARRPDAPWQTGTPAGALLTALRQPAERAILLAAGAAAIYAQAGRRPDPAPTLPVPCPPETQPLPTPRGTALLGELFAAHHALLPEALALLARTGRCLPPSLLVAALSLSDPALRAASLPVLGARGRWLADHNAAWSWVGEMEGPAEAADPARAEALWQEGRPQQRVTLLTRMRGTNPTLAREWLAAAWKREKADLRHELLGALAVNLSADDEPFLEAALDDRSEKVRGAAAALLARLPGSALAGRVRTRADTILSSNAEGQGGALGRIARAIHGGRAAVDLAVTLPRDVDGTWPRDGIAAAPAATPESRWPVWWMQQVLGLVPPGHWSARFERTPEELIAAAGRTEWEEQIVDAWSHAALLHRDAAWAGALWEWWLDRVARSACGYDAAQPRMPQSLLAILPREEAERRVAPLFGDGPHFARFTAAHDPIRLALISQLPTPWGAALSSAALDGLHRFIASDPKGQALLAGFWPKCLELIAVALPPSCLEEELALWQTPPFASALPDRDIRRDWHGQRWAESLARFVSTLRLRRRLHQEHGGP